MKNDLYIWRELFGIHTLEIGPAALRVKFQIEWKNGEGGPDRGYRASINGAQSLIVFKTLSEAKHWVVNTTKNNVLTHLKNILLTLEESVKEEDIANAHTS